MKTLHMNPHRFSKHGGVIISKEITTETAHRLINYEGKCAHIHGHSWTWTVHVEVNKLQDNGIGIDFGRLKSLLRRHIHDVFDHALVLCKDDPLVKMLEDAGWGIEAALAPKPVQASGGILMPDPDRYTARVVLLNANPTSENLALYAKQVLEPFLREEYPEVLRSLTMQVCETCTSAAEV